MNLVNNKIKQFAAGNWGCDQFVKKSTRIPDPLSPEISKRRARRKRQKTDFEAKYYSCPFCHKVLPLMAAREMVIWLAEKRVKKCDNCGAENKNKGCPACKQDIWFKDGVYKHGRFFLNCGFVGRKLNR